MKEIPYLLLLSLIFYSFTGVHYHRVVTDLPQSIHVFEIDPKKCVIVPARALEGRETVREIARRHRALCAFNGGFFSEEGEPRGILKIKREWLGFPSKPRGAVGWRINGEEVLFDRLLTHQEGNEVVIDPQTGLTLREQWEAMEHIVGGAPLLIQRGIKIVDYTAEHTVEPFRNEKHARTAVGLLSNGNWVFVVVDGKQPDFSVGMTMEELAHFMEKLGCLEALNLDGGGSSTCVYKGEVVNHPIQEKAVSDAILVLELH